MQSCLSVPQNRNLLYSSSYVRALPENLFVKVPKLSFRSHKKTMTSLRLRVRTPDGQVLQITELNGESTVLQLQQLLQSKSKIPTSLQERKILIE
jgi:hypothetical protein